MELPNTAITILDTLLDRFEQPERQRVVRVRLNERDQPDYFAADDALPRQATNAALRTLAKEGMLKLHWRKWEEDNWLETVDLVAERVAAIYALRKRSPRDAQDAALRALLTMHAPRSGWHAAFLAWAHAQLDAYQSVAPLVRTEPTFNTDLLKVLGAVADLGAPTLERSLSVRLFGDSKRLEALRAPLLRVLRRHDPNAADFADDDSALLRSHNLNRVPEYVPLAGPLTLRVPTNASSLLDLAPFRPSVALSAELLRQAEVAACTASMLVTVENATSFSELLTVCAPDLVVVYTGGFASPTVIRFLQAMHLARPDLPLLHWGDLDAGGLRILAHLREHVGTLTPLAMNPATFAAYRAFAQPLTSSDRSALRTLRQHTLLADCLPLIDTLLAADQKLEQEAIVITDLFQLA